jgi:hypothetical protein
VLLNDGKDKLVWKWLKGAATDLAALGNPVAGDTDYAACIYSTTGGIPALVMSAVAPGGSSCGGDFCWHPIRTKGFKYVDPPGTANGLTKIVLRTGANGEAKVIVQGKGPALPIPPPADMNTLLRQDPSVTVQVVNSAGQCWEAAYSAPATKLTGGLFKDGL